VLEKLLRTSIAELCMEYFSDARVQGSMVSVDDVIDPWAPGSAWIETYFHQAGRGFSVCRGRHGHGIGNNGRGCRRGGR
jgi:hypothetical protein